MSRLRRILRRVRDGFPLTGLGLAIAALVTVALVAGFSEVDLVLLGAGAIGLVALLVSLVTVTIGWLRVRVALRRMKVPETPIVLECGYPVRTGFRLPRLRFVPGARVRWKWIDPAAKVRLLPAGSWLEEEVFPATRGMRDMLVRRIEIGDAFGLATIAFERTEVRAVRLLPSVGGLRQMHVVRTLSGGSDHAHPEGSPDGERLDIRGYAPGDPIKYVLWSVFARTRQLVIRTPERALSAAKKTLAYLVAGAGDEPAAGAARVAVDAGALGGEWAFGADGVAEPASTKEAALEALARSAHAPREVAGQGLATFMREAAATSTGRALVFVPGKPGPWLDGVMKAAAQLAPDTSGRVPLEFIVCTDGVHPGAKASSGLKRAIVAVDEVADASDAPVAPDELSRVVQALGRLRARVIVVDRRHGHVHVAGH
jgi:hypothetical protein